MQTVEACRKKGIFMVDTHLSNFPEDETLEDEERCITKDHCHLALVQYRGTIGIIF